MTRNKIASGTKTRTRSGTRIEFGQEPDSDLEKELGT